MWHMARELAWALGHLGKPVRLAAKQWQQPGRVVAVILTRRPEALVRWTDTESTLEALDDLIDEHGLALTRGRWCSTARLRSTTSASGRGSSVYVTRSVCRRLAAGLHGVRPALLRPPRPHRSAAAQSTCPAGGHRRQQ
jgi:hypothetical protein